MGCADSQWISAVIALERLKRLKMARISFRSICPLIACLTFLDGHVAAQNRAAVKSNPSRISSQSSSEVGTVRARSRESLRTIARRLKVSPTMLAELNGVSVDSKFRNGQRIILPPPESTKAASADNAAVVVGKRIVFADGATLDVDDAWRQGHSVWFTRNGTSQRLDRQVKGIESRFKESITIKPALSSAATAASTPRVMTTWIYLVGGARFQTDEIREFSEGTWYKRGNLTMFLDRERIARIEREQPDASGAGWRERGWSSGNATIDEVIRKNGTRFGVDPYLVFLVIEQESHFRTRAVSPKGARGLMQLMPGTARRLGVRNSFDPIENIRGGTQYLKELMTMFRGKVDLVLASYNAGEGRVLEYGNKVPPFKETRDYVRRIGNRYRKNGVSENQEKGAPPLR